jgi:hypothetical protein
VGVASDPGLVCRPVEEALAGYRGKDWKGARRVRGLSRDHPQCRTLSKIFLGRIAQFSAEVPSPDRDGVWVLAEKYASEFGVSAGSTHSPAKVG